MKKAIVLFYLIYFVNVSLIFAQISSKKHKGVVNINIENKIMSNLKLSYAYWILMGEPVMDFKIYWKNDAFMEIQQSHVNNWKCYEYNLKNSNYHLSKNMIKNEFPHLLIRFNNIKPAKITINANVNFYLPNPEDTSSFIYIGSAKQKIFPDLIPTANNNHISSPTSKNWKDIFTDFNIRYPSKLGDTITLMKKIYSKGRVEISRPLEYYENKPSKKQIVNRELNLYWGDVEIEWNKKEIASIIEDCFCKEEKEKTEKKEEEKEEDDFWSGKTKEKESVNKETDNIKKSREDDFWNGKSKTNKNIASKDTKNKGTSEDDFWSGKNSHKNSSNEDFWSGKYSTNTNDDFWAGKNDKNGNPTEDKYLQSLEFRYNEGFFDKSGKLIIKAEFMDAKTFSDGLCAVESEDGWGFINRKGEVVIPFKYDKAASFSESLAAVRSYDSNFNYRWGFINRQGEVVIPFRYVEVKSFSESFAAVLENYDGNWGFINKLGKVVIPFKYIQVKSFSESLAAVKDEYSNKWGFINKQGNIVWDYQFDVQNTSDWADFKFKDGLCNVYKKIDFNWGTSIVKYQIGVIKKDGTWHTPMITKTKKVQTITIDAEKR